VDRWADEQILTNSKMGLFETGNQWPVVAALTCLNGYYAFPGAGKSISENWLFLDTNHGAVANFAPTAVDFYDVMRLFIREFMQSFADDWPYPAARAGEVNTRAQVRFAVKYPTLIITAREYHLFGDPATDLTLIPPPPAGLVDWERLQDD
jgi:hypothetical protein